MSLGILSGKNFKIVFEFLRTPPQKKQLVDTWGVLGHQFENIWCSWLAFKKEHWKLQNLGACVL